MGFLKFYRKIKIKILLVIGTCSLITLFALIAGKQKTMDCTAKNGSNIKHLAIIMDGNRRWAKERGLQSFEGHKQGIVALETTIKYCLASGIKNLSLYTFSLENFKRAKEENEEIFGMFPDALSLWKKNFDTGNVKVRFVGDRALFPEKTVEAIEKIESETQKNDGLFVNLMFCYGGQQEIVDSVKKIAQEVKTGKLDSQNIDIKTISKNTWTGDISEPDLIIRTGKRNRLSNFMTFQSSYSEIVFSNLNWPEIGMAQLEEMCEQYAQSQRTFGA